MGKRNAKPNTMKYLVIRIVTTISIERLNGIQSKHCTSSIMIFVVHRHVHLEIISTN